VVAAALGGAPAARGQIGAPIGPTFLVNSYTTEAQVLPSISADAAGGFVVVWQSYAEDGGGWGIFGRRHEADGGAKGPPFAVNSTINYHQAYPRVASSAGGDFLVVWDSFGQDGSSFGVFAQRYDASGDVQGVEVRINTHTAMSQSNPAAAWTAEGQSIVVWPSELLDGNGFGVFARRYDTAGTASGPEFQVNTYTTGEQAYPAVAVAPDGRFVVVWEDFTQDGSGLGVFGRLFDAAGVPLGGEFRANAFTTGHQGAPAVVWSPLAGFVVVWHGQNQDGSGLGTFARRFDALGTPVGSEFVVNSFTSGQQGLPAVAADAGGGFVVVWVSGGAGGNGAGVFGQWYNSAGTAAGAEFLVQSFAGGAANLPRVASSGRGFVVAWQGETDGSGYGIFAQRYQGDVIFADGFQ
jgi:hypothetical protein